VIKTAKHLRQWNDYRNRSMLSLILLRSTKGIEMKILHINNLLERRAHFTPLISNIRATTAHYIRKISGRPSIRLSTSYAKKETDRE